MKKLILGALFRLINCQLLNAQDYRWIKGGGSLETMSPSANYEQVTTMCTDANGNVYAASVVGKVNIVADTFYRAFAYNTGTSLPHILLTSYNCDGTMRWAKLIESSNYAHCGGLAYLNGNIYMVGTLSGGDKHIADDTTITSTYLRSFTMKFDTLGTRKWIRFIGADALPSQVTTGDQGVLAIDGHGYIHNFNGIRGGCEITPSMTTSVTGTYDLKYDATGNLVNVDQVTPVDSLWMITKAVYDNNSGKFYATLQPNQSYWYIFHADYNSAVAAFRPDESMIWMDTTGANGFVSKLDYKGGNIYVAGGGQTSLGSYTFGGITVSNPIGDAFGTVFHLDTNGVAHWVYNLQSTSSVDQFQDIVIVPGNKIAVHGFFAGKVKQGTDSITSTAGEQLNPLLLIIDTAGHTLSIDQFHGPAYDDYGMVVTADQVGNLFCGGSFGTDISVTSLATYTTHGGNTDFYVIKYGHDCSCTLAPVADFTHTPGLHMSFTYTGAGPAADSIVWHYSDGGHDTGSHPSHTFTATGSYTVCATVYTACGSDMHCSVVTIPPAGIQSFNSSDVKVYPNPALGELIVAHAGIGNTVRLLNVIGQEVYRGLIGRDEEKISLRDLKPGNYLLQITNANGYRIIRTLSKE